MKVVCLALLVVQCSCSKDELRIPNVSELTSSGGSITNIGGNNQNGGGGLSIGNIANIAQSNIGQLNSLGNLGNNGLAGIIGSLGGLGNLGNILGNTGSLGSLGNIGNTGSIGNIATVVQTNIDTTGSDGDSDSDSDNAEDDNNNNNNGSNGSQVNIGNIANIAQSNIQGSQGGIGNIGTIIQSNIGGSQGIGNIANIDQSNIGAILALLNIMAKNNNNNNDYIDEDKYIQRPCQFYDLYCIKKYFAEHSKCKKSYGPVADPKYRAQSTSYLPILNVTVVTHDGLYSGLNGQIREFYYNKKTENVVFSVEFKNVVLYSANAYFKFHRRGKEPIVTRGYIFAYYESFITTTIIPNKKELELEKSETTSYVATPIISVGESIFDYPDPSVQIDRFVLLSNIGKNAQEAQLTEAPYHAATFIQDSICDFGLKVL